jgi:hypothetical protein
MILGPPNFDALLGRIDAEYVECHRGDPTATLRNVIRVEGEDARRLERSPRLAAKHRATLWRSCFKVPTARPLRAQRITRRGWVGKSCRKPSAKLRSKKACTRYARNGSLAAAGTQGPNFPCDLAASEGRWRR